MGPTEKTREEAKTAVVDPHRIVNLRGAEKIVGVGTSSIRYWILSGKLRAKKNERGGWEIRVSDLLEADRVSREGRHAQPRGRKGRLTAYGPELKGRPVTEPLSPVSPSGAPGTKTRPSKKARGSRTRSSE